MTPAEILELLRTTTPDLSPRIRESADKWPDNPQLKGRFLFLPFRSGQPTIDELIEVAHARIVNFAIPATRIAAASEEAAAKGAADALVRLNTEARDLFIKTFDETGRSGEFGELLLYMLVEWLLKAPIIACKMYLKTSQQMPVHGMDGIFLGCNGPSVVLYWGESKVYEDLSAALSAISESISEHSRSNEGRQNEVRIIRSSINETVLTNEARGALAEYFNPYRETSNRVEDCYACLAAFSSKLYKSVSGEPSDQCEEKFRTLYSERIQSALEMVTAKLKEAKLDSLRFIYFLFPLPDVGDARERFQKKLWGRE